METLTSRKLIAALAGLTATVVCFGFLTFGGSDVGQFDKTLLAITTITLTAIGAQALIDQKKQPPQ